MTWLDDWQHERRIRKLLRTLKKQRMYDKAEGQNAWIVKFPIPNDDALRTCLTRGWVKNLSVDSYQHAIVKSDPTQQLVQIYSLTDSGWNAVQRTHAWLVRTFVVALLTLVVIVLFGIPVLTKLFRLIGQFF